MMSWLADFSLAVKIAVVAGVRHAKSIGFKGRKLKFRFWLCHLLIVWLWASHMCSQAFTLLICKTRWVIKSKRPFPYKVTAQIRSETKCQAGCRHWRAVCDRPAFPLPFLSSSPSIEGSQQYVPLSSSTPWVTEAPVVSPWGGELAGSRKEMAPGVSGTGAGK